MTDSPGAGAAALLDQRVIVVNQKAKLVEVTQEYGVFDQQGNRIGGVREVGQSTTRKVLRFVSNLDQYLTHRFEVVDASEAVVLTLTRPAKLMKSRLVVSDGAGRELGQIVQQNVIGKIRFALEADGRQIGTLRGENWRAWNFAIEDAAGREVARVTKTWEGLAKNLFTTADNYVVEIHEPLQPPLRELALASALGIDTALKQDARGLNLEV